HGRPVEVADAHAVVAGIRSSAGAQRVFASQTPGRGPLLRDLLNPSTADAEQDDATVRKCMGLSRRWGCGKVQVVNLFAFRSTDPKALRLAADPIGPANAVWLGRATQEAEGPVVCAWGTHGAHLDQDLAVLRLLGSWKVARLALGVTKEGH